MNNCWISSKKDQDTVEKRYFFISLLALFDLFINSFFITYDSISLFILQILTNVQEKQLGQYIIKCSKINYGLTIDDVCKLAFRFAQKVEADYPANWDDAGKATRDWYYAFVKRHGRLSLLKPTPTSANRAKGFNKQNVYYFFNLLKSALDEHPYLPNRIWNADESGFPTVPTKPVKIVSEKGSRATSYASAERGTNVTMTIAVSAAGDTIPPFYLYPRKNMQSAYLYNSTPNDVGFANGSGWMTSNDFIEFMKHFVKFAHASKENPSLLLMDNHRSHVTIKVIVIAIEHGITILTLPPHCSHKLQPLDVGVFGPLKKSYAVQCDAWTKNHIGLSLEITHVAEIAAISIQNSMNSRNIASGFQRTGIFPFNPEIFAEEDFVAAEGGNEVTLEDIESMVSDEEPATHKKVSSVGSSAVASTSQSILDEVSPLRRVTPKKKSKRGRKPIQSAIITSPDNRKVAEEAAAKRSKSNTPPPKKGPTKKVKRSEPSSSSKEDRDFCLISTKLMPHKMTKNNSIECHTCERPFHLKCIDMGNRSYFTCQNCDSDLDLTDME